MTEDKQKTSRSVTTNTPMHTNTLSKKTFKITQKNHSKIPSKWNPGGSFQPQGSSKGPSLESDPAFYHFLINFGAMLGPPGVQISHNFEHIFQALSGVPFKDTFSSFWDQFWENVGVPFWTYFQAGSLCDFDHPSLSKTLLLKFWGLSF